MNAAIEILKDALASEEGQLEGAETTLAVLEREKEAQWNAASRLSVNIRSIKKAITTLESEIA